MVIIVFWDLQGHTLEETELPETLHVPESIMTKASSTADLFKRIDDWLYRQYDWTNLGWEVASLRDLSNEDVTHIQLESGFEDKRTTKRVRVVSDKPWSRILNHIVDQSRRETLVSNIRHNSKEGSKLLSNIVIGLGAISDAITECNFKNQGEE